MSTEMDITPPNMSVNEEEAPVLASENQFEDSDNETEAVQVLASEDQWDDSDKAWVATADCEDEEEEEEAIEPFEDYKPKIEQLLASIGFPDCDIEAIQHDMQFQNCVYALTSQANSDDQYILRVPMEPELREDDGVCEAVLNDAALLGHLAERLPVPRVVAYSATGNNVLEEPYMLQTRLPGVALDGVFERLTHQEKLAIIDQYVDLIAKLEAITFEAAGTFTVSAFEPVSSNKVSPLDPHITFFNQGDEEFVEKPETAIDRAGPNVKALFDSHIDGWLETERKYEEEVNDDSGRVPYYNKMKEILNTLQSDNTFDQPQPIVLYHWDLEARNVMVTSTPDGYKITGIIDWDGALASPRVLARRAPDWIWDFDHEGFTGYKDTDHHPNLDLSADSLALKNHFDEKARLVLGDQYLEDAYGIGRLLRRIWSASKEPLYCTTAFYLMVEMCEEWDRRSNGPEPVSEQLPSGGQPPVEPKAVLDTLPLAEQQVAKAVVEPQKFVGLWAKVVHCFRRLVRKIKAGW